MKKLNCLSIQEKKNSRLIYREKSILGEAEYHNRSHRAKSHANTEHRPTGKGHHLSPPWVTSVIAIVIFIVGESMISTTAPTSGQ